jgi:1-acyl-sn-glycerol-3-phosphate acyltransferase
MFKIFFSFYVWCVISLATIVLAPFFVIVWLLTVAFDKRLLILNYVANYWGSLFTILVPGWDVQVIGKEKLNNAPKIIVANHQSQEDILLIYRLGIPFRWVSKAEVFKIPIYGWLMYLKGDIKLLRSSKSSIRKMFIDAETVLNKGNIITIFPEGTRSKIGKLGNFKEGAFKLAQNAQVPISPVIISRTGAHFLYPNGIFKGRHKVVLKVLNEIPYSEFKNLDSKEFSLKVRELMNTEINQLNNTNE